MKTLFSSLTLLGALAGAAAAAPYVLPSPQPGALTPYDVQPVYGIEGFYSIEEGKGLPNTYGVRGSFNLYDSGIGTFRHQFDINVAGAWGSDGVHLPEILPNTAARLTDYRADLDLFLLPITMGYNLNIELFDSVMLYMGGKAGYAWSHGKITASGKTNSGLNFSESRSMSKGGFTYSVGGGIKVQCSDSVYVHAGYEFGRSYLDYNLEGKDLIYGAHTIYAGFGCQF